MAQPIQKYGVTWPAGSGRKWDLNVEMACIKLGGSWENKSGAKCGRGLPYHYERMRRIIWPDLDGEHNGQRWHVICRDNILSNKICVLMGCGSSGKTHSAAWIYLCEYLCFPDETCVLVSSTDRRGLKLRVWGEIVKLWESAVRDFDHLPGHMLDNALAITTDTLDDKDVDERTVRDMRKGISGVPCMNSNNTFVGLTKYHGIKQKRLRLIADEAAMMGVSFLKSFANLNNNEDFRAIILGNPNDTFDPLGKAAEPLDGWAEYMDVKKTSVWKTRFMNGVCVNLVGPDSPNFDPPLDRFKYLIGPRKIQETLSAFRQDSYEFHTQCVGTMITSTLSRRVLTRNLAETHHAMEQLVNWEGGERTRIYFVDAAYGGDRCVGGWGEFGKVVGGKTILLLHQPTIIPVSVKGTKEPEEQIAEFVKKDCEINGIQPANMGHDSTGRGSLGTFMARVWSAMTNPVEAGGKPTKRPVSLDHYVIDPKTKNRRLKLCDEHYVKLVTEFWFSVRYAVESEQLRGLNEETMEEFSMREWDRVAGDRIELEPKTDMKERTGRSPDLADWAAGIVEMARRIGFQISKLANKEDESNKSEAIRKLRDAAKKSASEKELTFT